MLRAEEETIDIQMTHEIAKARWIDFVSLFVCDSLILGRPVKLQVHKDCHLYGEQDLSDKQESPNGSCGSERYADW